MKLALSTLVLIFSISSFASPEHVITVKERLRYELWYQGISPQKKVVTVKKVRLPEEISRPLRNF